MTSLLSLDLRGNFGLSPVIPDGLFSSLINLKTLKVNGEQFLSESSRHFMKATKSLKSLDSFAYQRGDIQFGIQIASQLTNLTSQEFRDCDNNDKYTLARLLDQMRNLTKLNSLTLISCNLEAVGNNISLDWMHNLKNINLACNFLNIKETISFLGSQSSLSQLDTLVLDRIDRKRSVFDCDEILFSSNTFCNLSFSSSLRRLSIQKVRLLYYEAAMFRCLHNLRSISVGHNLFIDILDDGRYLKHTEKLPVVFKWLTSPFYVRFSALMSSATTGETYCYAEDNTFDQYFIDENLFQIGLQPTMCEGGIIDKQLGYIKLPSCVRALQFDHWAFSTDYADNNLQLIGLHFSPNNSLELLDFSHSVFINGLIINALSLSGLHKLRIVKFRHMNIKRFYMVALNQAENLYDIDLSDNRFEEMTEKQLSLMFTKPLTIRKLNLSSCGIIALNSDFLRQFPQLTFLDISHNKLSLLSLNLSGLNSSDSLIVDLSFNQISTVNDSFVESIKLIELHRPITIKLNNNQFRCDCDTLTFLKWFQSTNIVIDNKQIITCDYRGINKAQIVSVDISELELQCTKFMRILYISLSCVFSITAMGITLGVILFKYRWHIRWNWFRVKRRILQTRRILQNLAGAELLLVPAEYSFICYINYVGVTDEWMKTEIMTPLENLEIGDVFLLARNAVAGVSISDAIMEAINNSRKLLYIVGNEPNAGEQQWFFFSLHLAMVERLEDIIFIYRDIAVHERLQQKLPLLRPSSRNPIRCVQYEANDMFWPEVQQHLSDNQQNETEN